MPLAVTLNTNEIKNAAATEVEFTRKNSQGSTVEYAQINEPPNREHRFKIQHREVGTGIEQTRQSNLRFRKEITGASGTVREIAWSLTGSIPVGDVADLTETKNLLAEMMSFCATTGAGTTVLFDCTGNGADALVNGNAS